MHLGYASEKKRQQEQAKKELELQITPGLLEDKHKFNCNTSINNEKQQGNSQNWIN